MDQLCSLSQSDRLTLLGVARESIAFAVGRQQEMEINSLDYPAMLQTHCGAFTTLKVRGDLRGCIGCLIARRPLIVEVCHTAYGAAFMDDRFPPVSTEELPNLHISVSVLTPLEELHFSSEAELLDQLRPGRDGVVLRDSFCQGAFLPIMWERLKAPGEFLRHLKLKAGLPANHWSGHMKAFRFEAMVVE